MTVIKRIGREKNTPVQKLSITDKVRQREKILESGLDQCN
jgi:hypothetical protein